MAIYLIQTDANTRVAKELTATQAATYALSFPVYTVNPDNTVTLFGSPSQPPQIVSFPDKFGLAPAQVAAVTAPISGGAAIATTDQAATQMPDEVVLLSASGCACASPCYISKIRCVTGASVALTVYDNAAASSGTVLYTNTLSAGQEAVLSAAKVRSINGVRGAFASGTFEFSIGQEAA